MEFSDWLIQELNARDWTQADLARASGLTTAAISRLISGSRGAGPETCTAIANALKLPPEFVFRKAGLLPTERTEIDNDRRFREQIIEYKTRELSDDQQEELLQFLEFIQDRDDDRTDRRQMLDRHTREGETPPEQLNN